MPQSPPHPSVRYFVSGTSRGIGLALAMALLERGEVVVGCSRTGSRIDHPAYTDLALDVTDEAAVKRAFSDLRKDDALPDVLIVNAGLAGTRPALLTGADAVRAILDVNVVGAFLLAREALRYMMRTGFGRIVLFSSINTRIHSAGGVAYNASKAAVEEIGRTLSREVGRADVTVNTLGLSMVAGAGMAAELSAAEVDAKTMHLAKAEPTTVDEILHAVDFLADPDARGITGQTIFFGGVA